MPLATVYSRARFGVDAPLVTVEVHLSNGLPSFAIVGLPETAVKESKDRVRSALLNSRLEFPARRITVNLAPADLPKDGGRYDLPIAIGILAASGQIPMQPLEQLEFIGELSLGGELRPIDAVLPAAIHCSNAKRKLVLPEDNYRQAAISKNAELLPAQQLLEICSHLLGESNLQNKAPELGAAENNGNTESIHHPDLEDVKGQVAAKRALEICAAGGHNLLLSGPPGTGKTLLASRLPSILPELAEHELLSTAAILSVASRRFDGGDIRRPFRAPHHTASAAALVGGGSQPRPGEISLAHNGVLFLDELPEFPRKVLDVLREPLESGEIMISRANQQVSFPSNFQLVAAMNPCPCGYHGDPDTACRCTPDQILRYSGRISGPLLDRIDLQINVPRLAPGVLQKLPMGESSEKVRQRVEQARGIQLARQHCVNAKLGGKRLDAYCGLTEEGHAILSAAESRLNLSSRAHHRILKVARTIADLDKCEQISANHLSEALSYRS